MCPRASPAVLRARPPARRQPVACRRARAARRPCQLRPYLRPSGEPTGGVRQGETPERRRHLLLGSKRTALPPRLTFRATHDHLRRQLLKEVPNAELTVKWVGERPSVTGPGTTSLRQSVESFVTTIFDEETVGGHSHFTVISFGLWCHADRLKKGCIRLCLGNDPVWSMVRVMPHLRARTIHRVKYSHSSPPLFAVLPHGRHGRVPPPGAPVECASSPMIKRCRAEPSPAEPSSELAHFASPC